MRMAFVMRAASVALLGAALAAPGGAQQTLENVEIHGYGGWSYGRTVAVDNANFFLYAHNRGDYSHSEYALNLAIPLNDRLTIDAQPFWHAGHHTNQTESGLDYAFAEWKYSDHARLRVGSVKQPFGIYTEVFDVGTVRPFAALPQSVYGPTGFVGKAYTGIGLTGSAFGRGNWGVTYDVYGGGLNTVESDVGLQVLAQGPDTLGKSLNLTTTRTFRDVVGGRVLVHTPVDGLTIGASSYTGTRPVGVSQLRRNVVGGQAEFLSDAWSLRTEYTNQTGDEGRRIRGGYGEAAYRLTEHWQVATMYDVLRTELVGVAQANVDRAPSLQDHEQWGAGLNYWFSPNFVLKASYHAVTGNRFAAPLDAQIRAWVAAGNIDRKTDALLFGGQLSF